MGMDVYGRNPTAPEGEYFRNNVWYWRPLAIYINQVAPTIAKRCKEWHSNSGDGLNQKDSLALADILDTEVKAGRTLSFEKQWTSELEMLPDEPCQICSGTGRRLAPPQIGAGDQPCNGCDSKGQVRPHATWYPFQVSNVEDFIRFLRDCGGFKIL